MTRLIDANELKDNCYIYDGDGSLIGRREYVMFHEIDDAPTIDAVEIVRCKDCELWTEEKDEEDDILYGWCRAPFENDNLLVYGDDATRIFTAYDFFCKSGKRRGHGKDEAKGIL